MFRYWDGSTWSEVVSPTPLPGPPSQYGAPPTSTTPPVFDGTQPMLVGQGGYNANQSQSGGSGYGPYQSSGPSTQSAYNAYQTLPTSKSRKPVGMWITIVVGILALALIVWFVATRVFGGSVNPDQTGNPGGTSTTSICPKIPDGVPTSTATHPTDDGWVYGGDLAYPELGSPWSVPDTSENRVPFGRDVAEQDILIHSNPKYNPANPNDWAAWVISVLVGQLYAGDGFYAPEEASQIVNKCIFGAFYGNQSTITTDTLKSEAYTLDGYDGWITETNLSFSIPNLPTTSELAIVIIVATSEMNSSIFYASIPNDAVQYQPDVNQAIAGLKVVT